MTIRNKNAVQKISSQVVSFDIADLPLNTFVPLFSVPNGTLIRGGLSYVEVAAGGTTNVLDYGTSGAPTALLNDDDAKTVGATAFTGVNLYYATGTTFGVTRTETGSPSATGKFFAIIEYEVIGTVDEVYG